MLQEEVTNGWPTHSIENALLCMRSVNLDHASQLNGVGFNKLDSEFGNSLAEKVQQYGGLTFKQRFFAYKTLRKYRGQLLREFGISFDMIPEPVEEEPSAKPTVKGIVWLHGTDLVFDSPYNTKLVNALRVLPTRRWEQNGKPESRLKQKGVWLVPLTIDNIPMVRKLIEDFGLDLDPEAATALDQRQGHLEEMIDGSKALDADVEVPNLGITLLPFQRAAVAFARKVLPTGGMYIADEMGLGKTVETLAIAEDHALFPALVAVPDAVWLNWAIEGQKVLPHRKVTLLAPATVSKSARFAAGRSEIIAHPGDDDTAAKLVLEAKADVFVVTYPNLLKWSKALMDIEWKLVTYDEAHLLKSRGAQRSKAAATLAKMAANAICLSGTPIPNAPSELITQINMLGRMDDLGGWKQFWYGYCGGWERGHRNEEELNAKMRSTFYLRRTKKDVYPELPEVRWVDVPVEMKNPSRYEQVEADLMNFIRERVENDEEVAALLADIEDINERLAMKKSITDEKYERAMRAQVLTLINALRVVVAQEKLPAMYRWLDSWWANSGDKKVIVFTDHREIGKAIAEKYSSPLILGGMDQGRKSQALQSFQEGNERLIVCAIQAAGLGITLTAASDVVFTEYPWRPMDMDQAVSRTYGRVNDLHGATAYQMIAPGTIDDKMLEKISEKRTVTGKVSDGSVFGAVLKDLLKTAKGDQ
jgi:SWI/SNF-related matrix-associated actin-dependent regulator 1 of chromatin subfamily A